MLTTSTHIEKGKVDRALLKDETCCDLLQAMFASGCCAIDSVFYGLPPEPLRYFDDHDGPIWLAIWNNELAGLIRTKCEGKAEEYSLEFCKNAGNPFATYDPADFKQKDYSLTKAGKVVTTNLLRLELLSYTNSQEFPFTLTVRYEKTKIKELDTDERDCKKDGKKDNQAENPPKQPSVRKQGHNPFL